MSSPPASTFDGSPSHTPPPSISQTPSSNPLTDSLEITLQSMVQARGPTKTLCPSEFARAIDANWRQAMPTARAIAYKLARQGDIAILQRGKVVPAHALPEIRGPIRIGMPRDS